MDSQSSSKTIGPEYGFYRGGTEDATTPDEGEVQNGVSQGFLQQDGKYFRTHNDHQVDSDFEETDSSVEKFGKTGDE